LRGEKKCARCSVLNVHRVIIGSASIVLVGNRGADQPEICDRD